MAEQIKRITSWSPSRYDMWTTCARKAKYKFVMKLEEPSNNAAARGTAIHELGERYLKGDIRNVPKEYSTFAEDLRNMRKAKASAEQDYVFDRRWVRVEWNDWKNAWLRTKVDALVLDGTRAIVTDFKTGRIRYTYGDQLEIYGIAVLSAHEEITDVKAQIMYLDAGAQPVVANYKRKHLHDLQQKWERRVAPMFEDTTFKATPGKHCKWCHYRKSNGGPCEHDG